MFYQTTHFCKGYTTGLFVFGVAFAQFKQNRVFKFFFMDRVAPYFSLVPSKSELTLFFRSQA